VQYEVGLKYAKEIVEILRPYTSRIEIAGGIRRQKAEPHDIEIVCVPAFKNTETGQDVFGEPIFKQQNLLRPFIISCLRDGIFTEGESDKLGRKASVGWRYYRLKYKGEKLDIFVVLPPAQWGVLFMFRTGDADFSHWLMSSGWSKGIRFIEAGVVQNNKRIDTPEEEDVFQVLGLPWIDPHERNKEKTLELSKNF